MDFEKRIDNVLTMHADVNEDLPRYLMIRHALRNREAIASQCGALATWTPPESTGRSPKDTYIVRRAESEDTIDWTAPNNIPMEPATFELIKKDALAALSSKPSLYVTNRVLGADPSYALPVKTVTDRALTALFTDNMFRLKPPDFNRSVFHGAPFLLVCLPYDKLDPDRYGGRLRVDPDTSRTSNMIAAMPSI